MCKSPLHIKNPSRLYRDGVSKMFLEVPCGKCKECIKASQDDWFVRAAMEYKRVLSVGGCVYFPTLTYNSLYLPYYSDSELGFSCPCFSRKHIKSFRDKFRIYLSRELTKRGYDIPATGIRYIIVAEFGGKKGRPHYHCLMFIPFHFRGLDKIVDDCLRRAWIYGFVGWSKKGARILSIQGIQYAMKYTSKPQYWLSKYKVERYIEDLKDRVKHDDPFEVYADRLKEFRAVMPHHYQSLFFGIDGLDYYLKDDKLDFSYVDHNNLQIDLSKLPFDGFSTLKDFKYNCPRYYYNKLFTYLDFDGVTRKNDRYQEWLAMSYSRTLHSKIETYRPYVSGWSNFISRVSFLNHTREEFQTMFTQMMDALNGRSLYDLAVYDLVYKDVPLVDGIDYSAPLDVMVDTAFEFLHMQKFSDVTAAPKDCAPCKVSTELFSHHRSCFNDLDIFKGLDIVLGIIQQCESEFSQASTQCYIEDEIVLSKLDKSSTYTFNPLT